MTPAIIAILSWIITLVVLNTVQIGLLFGILWLTLPLIGFALSALQIFGIAVVANVVINILRSIGK
jgi:hypothetical protein